VFGVHPWHLKVRIFKKQKELEKMKKIALFGGSGQSGKEFLKIAIGKDYSIRALVRNPQKLDIKADNLQVIKGDVLRLEDVEETISDADVVVSLFGHVKDSPDWLQTEGTKNIVSAMKKHGVKKIISLSGGGLAFPEKDQPKFPDKMIKFIMKIVAAQQLKDAEAHYEVLKESDLDWIIVRAPRLTNKPAVGDYRVGWVGVNASTQIARADLADFIEKQIESNEFIHQMPFVSY
jgi:putative NADH-flavin reductase